MYFNCSLDTLRKTVGIVEKAISSRSSSPILENILIQVTDSGIQFRATDLDIAIDASLPSPDIQTVGSVLVHGKTLSTILSKLNADRVSIQLDDTGKVAVSAGSTNYELLNGLVDDYPDSPTLSSVSEWSIPANLLLHLIKQTIFSVSFDETKQFLNGVLVQSDGQSITFVATDGFRLSVREDTLPIAATPFSTIIPYRGLNELGKILNLTDMNQIVYIKVGDSQIQINGTGFSLNSRLIKAQFPDYRQAIPAHSTVHYVGSRTAILTAFERSSIIASSSKNIIKLSFEGSQMVVTASAPTLGMFKESLDVRCVMGEGVSVMSFNVKLLLDGLRNLESDDVHFQFNQGVSPCVLRPSSSDRFTYVVMPIRTSDLTTA